jgi:ABC-type branched-subunit amino acid transport system substrate-binding protein
MVSSTASLSDTWRVGVLFSRTGLTAVTETEHFLGTALAIQEINQAGGVLRVQFVGPAQGRAARDRTPQRAAVVSVAQGFPKKSDRNLSAK